MNKSTAGFREGIDIMGRPDFGSKGRKDGDTFWKKRVKANMPYVHNTSSNACLIHKVATMWVYWYEGHYSYMRKLDKPQLIANTVCGQSVFLSNGEKAGKMCSLPDPNAVLCGRCHGELPTFSHLRKVRIKKRWAKDHLGCKGVTEVIEPYRRGSGSIVGA